MKLSCVSTTGDALLIAPPLIAEESHIEAITARLGTVLSAL
jgi:adenosylmethionine-8-amino-7-oxononanoate aminotransferase